MLEGTTVWIDITTPKDVRLFRALGEKLIKLGAAVEYTARKHGEILKLMKRFKMSYHAVGRYGGWRKLDKLLSSSKRIEKLASLISRRKPSVHVSFSSPEGCRVAFGLGIPIICVNDTPHAYHVGKLTLPLADYVVTPAAIPVEKFEALGAKRSRIVQYNGVDEVAWMKSEKPNPDELLKLGIDPDKKLVLVRPEESFAAYLENIVDREKMYVEPVMEVAINRGDCEVVFLPRYDEQARAVRRRYRRRVKVPQRVVDTASIYSFCTLVVSGGGTMAREAALVGTPSICCFPGGELDVNRFLIERGFPIWHASSYYQAAGIAEKILDAPGQFKVNTKGALAELEDPIPVLVRLIEKVSSS
ncbi:MAG: hypothetical protein DRN96_01110 [Thermoproteota archaeon]|nr:MAG: hypothetical protein DRN96_01110 [Candidatus Korarchaeota archaeon]RLG55214.1 MAG: hypothetical protein DRN99_03285 [Candidatus Korarchaeota archaeon]